MQQVRGKPGGQRQLRERNADHARLADEDPDVVESRTIFDDPARLRPAKRVRRAGERILTLGNDHHAIAGPNDHAGARDDVFAALADHRDLDPIGQVVFEILQPPAFTVGSQRNLAQVESLRLRGECRFDLPGHEIKAQDRTDHTKRIRNRISDGRIFVSHDVECRLQGRRTCHRTGVHAKCVPDLDAECLAQRERDAQAGDNRNQR